MTQSLTWTREGDKLVLVGELDQDVLNPYGMRELRR